MIYGLPRPATALSFVYIHSVDTAAEAYNPQLPFLCRRNKTWATIQRFLHYALPVSESRLLSYLFKRFTCRKEESHRGCAVTELGIDETV